MKLLLSKWKATGFILLIICAQTVQGQFLMDLVDTTTDIGKGILGLYKRFDRVQIGGYIQPQFQVAESKGTKSFNGGDFSAQSDNRFMLRRGRLRIDYAHFTDSGQPVVQFIFQIDGTERGVQTRDFWGRFYENRFEIFSVTAGLFARPFGYEVNLGSPDRESPERGRMSQILMRTERDLGAMVSFEPRRKKDPLRYLKWDAGIFNGQGLTAPGEFDSHKDFITRLSLKPYPLSKNVILTGGLSYLNGGLLQNTRYVYTIADKTNKAFVVDSSLDNIGKIAPRKYYGVDGQLQIKNGWGFTKLRGEYWFGKQTSFQNNSETPTSLLNEPIFIRKFDGAFFYLLQNIVNSKHQIGLKYDWYDPNTDIDGMEIGVAGSNLTAADIKFSTFSFGYNYYITENVKLLLWYDIVKNESTPLTDFTEDVKDNIFTCRLQFRF